MYFSLVVVWQKLAFPAILACYCAYRITRISAAFGTKKLVSAAPKFSARRPNEQTQKTLILLLNTENNNNNTIVKTILFASKSQINAALEFIVSIILIHEKFDKRLEGVSTSGISVKTSAHRSVNVPVWTSDRSMAFCQPGSSKVVVPLQTAIDWASRKNVRSK